MIRATSKWTQRVAKLRLPHIEGYFTTCAMIRTRPVAFRCRLLHHLVHFFPCKFANAHAALDPYSYTSGRWLRRDKLERDSRYIEFDFHALCKRVIELCPGAISIVSCEKKEGGYNRIFIFTCDNAKRVVARLPTSVAGPPRLTTNSEVATIAYREFGYYYFRTERSS